MAGVASWVYVGVAATPLSRNPTMGSFTLSTTFFGNGLLDEHAIDVELVAPGILQKRKGVLESMYSMRAENESTHIFLNGL